ncbi:MAG: hypothetical protein FJ295_12955 [Planctomycetes bacterium]|nr:hypothetical protein [Planctomycetota bacterium]
MVESRARLLIWERHGQWSRAWHGTSGAIAWHVHQVRGAVEVEPLLESARASFLAMECDAINWESRCDAALKWTRDYGQVRFAILACPDLIPMEPWFREIGAVDVAWDLRDLGRLTRLACRHLARYRPADLNPVQRCLERWGWLPEFRPDYERTEHGS